MSDVTDGELYTETTRGAVPADAVFAWEEADGSAAQASTLTEVAQSTAFSDLYLAAGALTAADVAVVDVGTFFTGTDVEAALQELGSLVASGYTDEQARDAIGTALVGGTGVTITVNDGLDTITVDGDTASSSAVGVVELATAAETTTGTDATRAVTPDGLAGSIFGTESVSIQVFAAATTVTTGDGKFYFRIPTALDGMNLVSCAASVFAKSTSGLPTIQLARGRQANATTAHAFSDMLSTRITIDANDFDSKDAAAAAVIDASTDDVLLGDLIRVDVDTAGTGTTGLFVTMGFQKP